MKALIADDHDVYRAGLALLLSSNAKIEVVEASGFDEALDRLADQQFDIAFFDLDMPGMTGAKTLAHVRTVYPDVKVVVVSANANPVVIDEMLKAGAELYLPKSLSFADMAMRIRALLQVGDDVQVDQHRPASDFCAQRSGLTARQLDVLRGIGKGLTNKEIARELGIAPGTVKIHLAALFDHFKASNRTELLILARP